MKRTFLVALLAGLVSITSTGVAHATTDLTAGHVDVVWVDYQSGAFVVKVNDDTAAPAPPVLRDPSDVVLHATNLTAQTRPAGSAYDFLGPAGGTVWRLPQTSDATKLWPGWNTEELTTGVFANNKITLEFAKVSGSGDFNIYSVSPLGAVSKLVDTGDANPDVVTVGVDKHVHANWVFEDDGDYVIAVTVRGTLAGTSTVVSAGPFNYAFHVG
ncbi:hypothetical protein Aple_009950 [Acrocarpospora pleiomorpha]|uniref:Surface-anchored protein n=1 Tax=Acrocarpospora pleiomorpha TaxID=90975 RepID=A0A5M3XAC9_9ACTN|nr:choice-of-anchor M domain-containing protein [Acrocarpospora pleiomorpha]GES18100.1 hypothetical protein Aple_009950 [Acrocarpospora pleiomorpha]